MTYREAQKEHHLRQLASLFEGDPGGGKYGRNVYPFVLQAPEKNLLASVREEVLLYFNGHLPGAEGTVHFWNPGGGKGGRRSCVQPAHRASAFFAGGLPQPSFSAMP